VPSERGTSPGPVQVASPATVTGTTAGMTKEEKAAEMARRKEERKQVRLSFFRAFLFLTACVSVLVVVFQRIAQLKEQKKNAAGAKG
jgi:hypothetical protein